jgi:hypothetical protein
MVNRPEWVGRVCGGREAKSEGASGQSLVCLFRHSVQRAMRHMLANGSGVNAMKCKTHRFCFRNEARETLWQITCGDRAMHARWVK